MDLSLVLSVIVPIYNVRKYLSKCIKSILDQSIDSMEVILVDDGSTDGSGEICDEWASTDDRIVVIHKPNGGVNTARNAGLDAASGKYITMVDGDDYIKPETFIYAISFIENNKVDFVQYPEFFIENGKERLRDRYPERSQVLTCSRDMISALIDPDGLFPGGLGGKIYKRDVWQELRLREDMQFCEDAYIFPMIMEKCNAVAMITSGGYCYVMRDGSATHSAFTPKKRLDCFRLKSIFFEAALKYDSYSGYWWNEACFAAIDAWTFWGPSDEIKDFLIRLQDTKHQVEKVRTNKKLVRTAQIFPPINVAIINRLRVKILP